MTSDMASHAPEKIDRVLMWRYIFAGLCASLDSIGLARFAFTPLIPELIQAHWFSASSVIYLGSANLAGYVCGALIGRPIASRVALLLGAEGSGLSTVTRAAADLQLQIAMAPGVDSLNVAAAAAIALHRLRSAAHPLGERGFGGVV